MDFYFDRIAFYQRRSRRSKGEACESFRGISIWNTRENLEKWSGRKYRVGIQNVLKGGQRVAGRQSFVESGALRVEHWERSIELSSAERIQQIFGKFCDGREGFYIYIYAIWGGIKFSSWDRESTRACTRGISYNEWKIYFWNWFKKKTAQEQFSSWLPSQKRGRNVVTLHFLCRGSTVTTTFIISDVFLRGNVIAP